MHDPITLLIDPSGDRLELEQRSTSHFILRSVTPSELTQFNLIHLSDSVVRTAALRMLDVVGPPPPPEAAPVDLLPGAPSGIDPDGRFMVLGDVPTGWEWRTDVDNYWALRSEHPVHCPRRVVEARPPADVTVTFTRGQAAALLDLDRSGWADDDPASDAFARVAEALEA